VPISRCSMEAGDWHPVTTRIPNNALRVLFI
jgi:hypothetical protein